MFALALLTAAAALAYEEPCMGVFVRSELVEALDAVEAAVADGNGALAQRILDDVTEAMRCADFLVAPADLGRLARDVSVVAFYAQDYEEMIRWAHLGDATLGGAPWPERLVVPERYDVLLADLEAPELVRAEPGGVLPPKGGGVFLDGRWIDTAEAAVGSQHLVQVVDKKGVVQRTQWQDGPAFPDALVRIPTSLEPPDWYVEPPAPPPLEIAVEPEVAAPEPVVAAPEVAPVAAIEPELDFREERAQQDCPWKGVPRNAWATSRRVGVNRQTFSVRTAAEQEVFREVLRACSEFRAARRFTRWRAARRKLSLDASRYRRGMVRALEEPEPVRKKRPPSQHP